MAYKLTYYKVIDNIRINFYEKDGVKATQEIGPVVQGLNLEIQGQQSDATAPIVKTSLNMVFCDAPDLDSAKKCGNWAEFYTPDATKWKVEVVTINEDGSADIEWSGFITPDSYMEELTYRGSVNIIARDNIGHLQDMDFTEEGDEVGMMTVKEILRTAWAKIEQPMMLTFDDYEDILWLQSEGIKAYDASINVSAFAGKTWNDVVEAVLDSFGLCMRYVGLNEVAVTPIRYLSLAGTVASSSTRRIIPTFEAGATRELTPACKMIIETSDYESASVSAKPITAEDFLGTEGEYPFLEDGENAPVLAPVMPISNQSGEGWSNNPSATLFFNPYAREIGSLSQRKRLTNEIRRYMYIAANNYDFSRCVTYRRSVRAMPCNIKLSLAEPITLEDNKIERTDGVVFHHLMYSLSFVQNGITLYYQGNGAWSSSHNVLSTQNAEDTLSIPVAFNRIAGGGILELNIIAIVYASKSGVPGVGLYASVQAVEFVSSSPTLAKNIVKTIYDERNNVIVEKSPILAPALDEVLLPGFIKNGIFVKTDGLYYPAKTWSWNGNGEQQLAVYKHLQYLTFTSKPNNLISGKIIGVPLSKIRSIWMFEGNEHLLISGRFNFLSNNIDNAILHEFTRYEDMWGEITDSATLPQVVTTEETTSASSGARSDAGNVNSTTVYIGSQGGGGSSTLAGLEDVNVVDILPSSLLVFNGSKWVDVPVASLFSNVNTKVTNLETKVNPIDTWFNEVGKYFKKDSDGVWYVDGSFYTKGQNAAGAVGSPDGGGSSGSGVMLLESWSDVPSSLSGYALSAALGIDLHERFNNYYTIGDVDSRFSGINSRLATLDSGVADRYTKAESDGRYLKLSGGTIENVTGTYTPLFIKTTDPESWIGFTDNVGTYYIGTYRGIPSVYKSGVGTHTLIHSGNVGDYALVKGSYPTSGGNYNYAFESGLYSTNAVEENLPISEAGNIVVNARYDSKASAQLYMRTSSDALYYRRKRSNVWSNWKTIAFTDTNVDSAQALKNSNGTVGATAESSGIVSFASHIVPNNDSQAYVGVANKAWYAVYTNGLWAPSGKTLYLGANNSNHIIVNTSGNVAINNSLSVSSTSTFSGLTTHNSGITTPHITIGGITISVVDGVLRIDGNVYTTGQLGVGAVGQEGGGTGGGGVLLLNTWPTDGGSYAGYAIGGNLGIDLNTRVKTLEGKATAVSFSQTLTSGKQIGVLTIDGSSEVLYAPSTYAWSEITSRPSKLSDFTDDVVAGKYLPLTGGTIDGNITIGKSDNTGWKAINFIRSGITGFIGNSVTKMEMGMSDGYIQVGKDVLNFVNNSTVNALIHSGNVGDYALVKGSYPTSGGNYNYAFESGLYSTNAVEENLPISEAGNIVVNARYDSKASAQLYMRTSSDALYYRRKRSNVWSNWKTVAFTDSDISGNAATATKLATARTIWGQSFDGTGNVSGDITMNNYSAIKFKNAAGTSALNEMMVDSNNYLTIGYDQAANSLPTRIDGSSVYLRYGTGHTNGFIINQSGNVTIGASDLAGTSAKLYVDGNILLKYNSANTIGTAYSSGDMTAYNRIEFNGSTNGLRYISGSWTGSNVVAHNFLVGTSNSSALALMNNGNVLIGTTSDKSSGKLQVNGGLTLKGYVTNGTVSKVADLGGNGLVVGVDSGRNNWGMAFWTEGNGKGFIQQQGFSNAATTYDLCLNPFGGNVGIGTNNPAYNFDVAGTARISGATTLSSTLSVSGLVTASSGIKIGSILLTDENGTLKIAGNAYTTGQLGAGEAGQPTSGGGSAILDYDSIVDALGFTPAKQNDLSSLTSRVLALESAGPSSSSSLYGDEITIGSSMGNIYISSENDVQIDSIMGSVLVNGSDVLTKANTSFTRSYTSGTKIGTIKIGGVSTDIYAPASGSSSLWSTEYDMTVGTEVLFGSKEYIGTNTIVGWNSAALCVNDLYIGYDGYTIWMQGSVDEASDMRLKTVIDAVNLDIRDIAFAPVFNYVFKSRPQGRQMLGSSAQYWQPITPSAVSENDKGNLAMNYGAVALASVVAVAKETLTQREEIATQREEIAVLKLKVQSLESRLAKYELN